MNKCIEIEVGPYPRGQLHMLRVEGEETLNELSWFDVDLWAKGLDETAFESAVLGANASVFIEVPPASERIFAGLVVSVGSHGSYEAHRQVFRLRLVPRAWLLQKREQSRIFQGKTVPEIVALVLDEHKAAQSWRLHSDHRRREYCVQYRETDWAFITRVLAEEGIFFWFQPPVSHEEADVMVFGDHPHSYAAVAGAPALLHRGQNALASDLGEDQIAQFRARTQIASAASELRDYDFRRPRLDPARRFAIRDAPTAKTGGATLEVFEHLGSYEPDGEPCDARIFLEQLRTDVRSAEGISACRRLMPGATFELTDHDVPSLDGTWVATRVRHVATAAEFVLPASSSLSLGTKSATEPHSTYENRFWCAPATVPCRPPRPARLRHQGVETAVVVGPPGQEIHTDAYGRIRVQFPWDRAGMLDEHSSCFIRVAQPWAGAGWGHQFIPRVGMEVLVVFVGGDPDQPLVTGSVPNAATPTPYGLPSSATRSGIRTQSSPGGGGSNEIAFEDQAGAEQLYVHAQRDLDEEVGRDRRSTIQNDRTETVHGDAQTLVHHTRDDRTLGDAKATVGGSCTVEIGAAEARKVVKGRTVEVGGDETHEVGGALALAVSGCRTSHVAERDRLVVDGDRSTTVRGEDVRVVWKLARAILSGGASTTVNGPFSFSVGTSKAPAPARGKVAGDLCVQGGGALELNAAKTIRLRVGKSVVSVGPDEVRIDADAITLCAKSFRARGSKATLSLDDAVDLGGKTVKLHSEDKAILELDTEAKLDGPAVKIKPGLAAEMAKADEREEQAEDLDKVKIHLFDRRGSPIRNAPYEVSFFGYLDEGTAADGTVEIPAFPDVEKAHVRWGRPKGERLNPNDPEPYEFEMDVFMVTSNEDPDEALRRKLHNLGHQGALHEAVHSFQGALGTNRTGLAKDVLAEVEARHASLNPVAITTKGAGP